MALLLETYKSSVDNPFAVEPPKNAENPEPPSNPDMGQNPQSTYNINLALIQKLKSDRKAAAEAGQQIQSEFFIGKQWYKANDTHVVPVV